LQPEGCFDKPIAISDKRRIAHARYIRQTAYPAGSLWKSGGYLCYHGSMNILLHRHEAEIEIKKSRFIAIAYPCESPQQIKELVSQTRREHPQATHVVHAAVMGAQGNSFSMSDDHEPKNTAGRPALEVLKGSGITNIAVMVVRYFGGTLLGTGGLVKAYGDSVKAVLDGAETEELIEKSTFHVVTSYDLYEQMKKLLTEHGCTAIQEEFTTDISFSGTLPTANAQALATAVTELSSGRNTILIQ